MIWRTSRSAETFHLFNEERYECALVLNDSLRHGIEISFISRASALGNHDKTIFVSLFGFNIYLGGKITFGVNLVIHGERRILRVTQIILSESVVNTSAQCFGIIETCPNLLPFFSVNYGGARILTERKHAFYRSFCIAQESERNIFVVVRSFRVVENGGNLFVVFATQHKFHIMECLLCKKRQSFGGNLQDLFSFKFCRGNSLF